MTQPLFNTDFCRNPRTRSPDQAQYGSGGVTPLSRNESDENLPVVCDRDRHCTLQGTEGAVKKTSSFMQRRLNVCVNPLEPSCNPYQRSRHCIYESINSSIDLETIADALVQFIQFAGQQPILNFIYYDFSHGCKPCL